MRLRWPLAAVPVAALLLAWWARAPSGRPERVVERTPRPVATVARPAAVVDEAPAEEAPEPRRAVARELPADGAIGRMVQAAMAKPGDSDPRLLDLLATTGLAPSALAPVGAAVDPWLAVGLVDLERQVARRCASRGEEGCWATALAAEEEVAAAVGDPGAAEALARFLEVDSRSE